MRRCDLEKLMFIFESVCVNLFCNHIIVINIGVYNISCRKDNGKKGVKNTLIEKSKNKKTENPYILHFTL